MDEFVFLVMDPEGNILAAAKSLPEANVIRSSFHLEGLRVTPCRVGELPSHCTRVCERCGKTIIYGSPICVRHFAWPRSKDYLVYCSKECAISAAVADISEHTPERESYAAYFATDQSEKNDLEGLAKREAGL